MKSKPLFPNQTVTQTGLPPSKDLIEIIQRIVADILEGETGLAGAVTDIAAIRSELGYSDALGGDVSNSTTTLASTGLGFPVVASKKYRFRFFVDFFTAVGTTGIRLTIDGPAATYVSYQTEISTGATTRDIHFGLSAYNLPATATATSIAGFNLAVIEGVIDPSADGTVSLVFASEVAASAATVRGATSVTWAEV